MSKRVEAAIAAQRVLEKRFDMAINTTGPVDIRVYDIVDAVFESIEEPDAAMYDQGRVTLLRVLFPGATPFEEADCQAAFHAAWRAALQAVQKG